MINMLLIASEDAKTLIKLPWYNYLIYENNQDV